MKPSASPFRMLATALRLGKGPVEPRCLNTVAGTGSTENGSMLRGFQTVVVLLGGLMTFGPFLAESSVAAGAARETTATERNRQTVFTRNAFQPWLLNAVDDGEISGNWIEFAAPATASAPATAAENPPETVAVQEVASTVTHQTATADLSDTPATVPTSAQVSIETGTFPTETSSTPQQSPTSIPITTSPMPVVAAQRSPRVFSHEVSPWIELQPEAADYEIANSASDVPEIARAVGAESDGQITHASAVRSSELPVGQEVPAELKVHTINHSSESPGNFCPPDSCVTDSCISEPCTDAGCVDGVHGPRGCLVYGSIAGGQDRQYAVIQDRTPRFCCRYWMPRELAPAQRLWPDRWAWAAAEDPWPRVFHAEVVPSLTQHAGSLHCPVNIDDRYRSAELNPARLQSDLPVAQMRPNISPKAGRMPEERNPASTSSQEPLVHVVGTERGWNSSTMHWNASQATHAPLYFEEPMLERAGYTRGYLQPIASGVYFFGTVPLLPGLMTIDPPTSVQYELGEVRPGTDTPYIDRRDGWTAKAVVVEAAVVLGLSFIIP